MRNKPIKRVVDRESLEVTSLMRSQSTGVPPQNPAKLAQNIPAPVQAVKQ